MRLSFALLHASPLSSMSCVQADEFAAASGELKGNIQSCSSAVAALTKGLQGSFLQSQAANTLRKLVVDSNSLDRYGPARMLSDVELLAPSVHMLKMDIAHG